MPQQKRSTAKFLSILRAFPRVVEAYGYDKASTEKIALEADVGIGTLYDYFSNKEAILVAYLDHELGAALDAVESASQDSTSTVIQALHQLVAIGIDFAFEQRDMIKLLFLHLADNLAEINLEQSRLKLQRIAIDFAISHNIAMNNKNPDMIIYTLTNLVIGFQFRIVAMPDNRIAKDQMINDLVTVINQYLFGSFLHSSK